MARLMDNVLFGYFVFQIVATIFFDTQGVYPESWYPQFLKSMRQNYLADFRDPWLANAWKHPWYLSICLVEHFIEIPFFFYAAYAYRKGAENVPSLLLPAIMYSVHTMTAVFGCWLMALMQDFTGCDVMCPRNTTERLKLCFAYSPFMIFSILCLIDSIRLVKQRMSRHHTD